MKRTPIQIATIPESDSVHAHVFVLCDDGSIWTHVIRRGNGGWDSLIAIPQPMPWWRRLARLVLPA